MTSAVLLASESDLLDVLKIIHHTRRHLGDCIEGYGTKEIEGK